ncbi:acid methyltransferase-like [Tropilaelaps mercedesae]|uniref:Acid methyltransferase-like n=1 Tax=Tropilaelaps mercedesae TaxID=418985 RepID=A0A1V9X1B7_9ACAR|nr:acid methyltransferase-like [Tropilaelaps mercedesae]
MQRDLYQNALQERILCELSQWTSEWNWRGAKVLDIGSRYGHRCGQLSQQLAPLRISGIQGVDVDVHGIEYATKHLADEKLEFSFIADLEDRLPLKYSQAFDWVLHINPTLFHLNNQEAALRNLLWCLKPSTGRLLLAIPCQLPADIAATTTKVLLKKMGKQLNQWMVEALNVNKKIWYGHSQADRIYAHIMERVGFCVHRTKIMEFRYKFEHKNEHKVSVESYFFDVIMSFPEQQRDALARRLYSSASGSSLRSTTRWDARYVLVLASRPAVSCSVCYGPRRVQGDTIEEWRSVTEDVPPPVPLIGPPRDIEGDVGELRVGVVHNDDIGGVDDNETDDQFANDDEGVAQSLKGNLFVDDISDYDRVADFDKVDDDQHEREPTERQIDHHQEVKKEEEEENNAYSVNGMTGPDEPLDGITTFEIFNEKYTENNEETNNTLSDDRERDVVKSIANKDESRQNDEQNELREPRDIVAIKSIENTPRDLKGVQSSNETCITRNDVLDEASTPVEAKCAPGDNVWQRRKDPTDQNEAVLTPATNSTVKANEAPKGNRVARRRRPVV